MGVTPWTDKELETLVEMRKSGVMYKDIAKVLGRTTGSVSGMTGHLRKKNEIVAREKELNIDKESGIPIESLREKFHVGQMVEGKVYAVKFKTKPKPKQGRIIALYKHHALVKLDNGQKECFLYFDLKAI